MPNLATGSGCRTYQFSQICKERLQGEAGLVHSHNYWHL